MQLVLSNQMSRGLSTLGQRLRRLVAKIAPGFIAARDAIGEAKHLMREHQDLIRRGDNW
jgi:hypothetical protein